MKKLGDLKPGQSGIVVSIDTTGALKRRLVDMGITPGVSITIRKMAPLGDPIEINLRGYELTIRKTEAQNILIENVTPPIEAAAKKEIRLTVKEKKALKNQAANPDVC